MERVRFDVGGDRLRGHGERGERGRGAAVQTGRRGARDGADVGHLDGEGEQEHADVRVAGLQRGAGDVPEHEAQFGADGGAHALGEGEGRVGAEQLARFALATVDPAVDARQGSERAAQVQRQAGGRAELDALRDLAEVGRPREPVVDEVAEGAGRLVRVHVHLTVAAHDDEASIPTSVVQ